MDIVVIMVIVVVVALFKYFVVIAIISVTIIIPHMHDPSYDEKKKKIGVATSKKP